MIKTGRHNTKKHGFTIVELAVIIVVIVVLTTITLVTYRGAQRFARDVERKNDIEQMRQALEDYFEDNGQYPEEAVSGSWEYSTRSGGFLTALTTNGYLDRQRVDPVNDWNKQLFYRYYRYVPGSSGCSYSIGHFYVLQAYQREDMGAPASEGDQKQCGTRNWSNEAWYTATGNEVRD